MTPSKAAATKPSSQKWLAVTTTTSMVRTGCNRINHRQRLGLTWMTARAIRQAHARCIDGMADTWSETPVPAGPYTDW
jgi:hypothetical protein